MVLQKLGRPLFPVAEEMIQRGALVGDPVADQQLGGRWRGTGARIEQRDGDLAAREGLVEDRKVADDDGEEAESDTGLQHGNEACERRVWRHVAETEREEGRAAHIEVSADAGTHTAGAELHQGKAEDETAAPDDEEEYEG